jgi:hypothetical protein
MGIDRLNGSLPPKRDMTTAKDFIEGPKRAKLPSPAKAFPFPSVPSSAGVSFATKKASLKDSLNLEEINRFLEVQSDQIEGKFKSLEHLDQNHELVDALLEMEAWGYEVIGSTNENVFGGAEFLSKVLPHKLLEQFPSFQKMEHVGATTSLIVTFLGALDFGAQGLALVCKSKILEHSKNLLKEFKAMQVQETSKTDTHSSEANQKKVLEWELQIQQEEETLADEKMQYSLSTTSNTLSLLNLPFYYLPKELIPSNLSFLAISGISWISSILGLVTTGISLKQTTDEAKDLHEWIKSYQQWLEHYQPTIQIPENLLQQKQASSSMPTANGHNILLQTGKNLLAKREAIRQKKVTQLLPSYHLFEDKIHALKKSLFVRDMQQLLWQTLQDPHVSSLEIEEQLNNWDLYHPERIKANIALLKAFEAFKMANQKEETPDFILTKKERLINELHKLLQDPTAMDEQFQTWFQTQSKENLLQFYVDHQQTFEQTTKNALKQMIQQKHTLESRFHQLSLNESRIHFSVAVISLAVSATLAVLGLLSIPFGGVGVILLLLSTAPFAISLGLLGASYFQSYYYKPQSTKALTYFFQAQLAWTKMRAAIQTYSHQTNEKKLLEVAKILSQLDSLKSSRNETQSDYHKALVDYKKAKLDFEQSQEKVAHWTERLEQLETHLTKKGWEDFAQYTSMKMANDPLAFDTLQAFQEALQACDLRLLSAETKTLLELQLGIDLETLQEKIQKEPEAVKKTLQEFFVLGDAGLVDFIRNQKARIGKGLLRPHIA